MPRTRTTATTTEEVINQANAQNEAAQAHDPAKETDPAPNQNPVPNPLTIARDQARVATKEYIGSGIVQGMSEILAGDFSGIEAQLTDAVEEFGERVHSPKLSRSAIAQSSSSLFIAPAKSSRHLDN